MKKQWWLLTIICSNLFAYEFKTIEQAAIDQAACSIKREIEKRKRKQHIVTCALIATGTLVSGIALYKWWTAKVPLEGKSDSNSDGKLEEKSNKESNEKSDVKLDGELKGGSNEPSKEASSSSELESEGVTPSPEGTSQPPKGAEKGIFAKVGNLIKSGTVGILKHSIIYGALPAFGGYYGSIAVASLVRFYRSFNWEWLLEDYLNINKQFERLKYTSAVLDPHSSGFAMFKDITINLNDQLLSVYVAREQQHITTFDELVKLKLIAERRITLDQPGILSYRELFVRQWNTLVDAVNCCLGYMKYRMDISPDAAPFEKNQVALSRDDIIDATQRLASSLPQLIKEVEKPQSTGLLAAIYEYANNIQHMFAVLDKNSIIG